MHNAEYAKWHTKVQVPNATLQRKGDKDLPYGMSGNFREALLWHMEQHGTKIVDLVRATGISRDVINKLLAREKSSTAVENAILVAAYYGKTVEQFIRCDSKDVDRPLIALADLLTPDEERMLEAQVKGLIAQRATR